MKLLTAFKNTKSSGFTLIELLVVIGILGILAAALVATIDPFEQLKKADDSKIKNLAVEFQTANVRYYTTHSKFPWNNVDNATANATCYAAAADVVSLALSAARPLACINNPSTGSLIAEGELKSGFALNLNDLGKVFLNWEGTTDPTNMIVCFAPQSKSQISSPETIYSVAGADISGTTCAPTATVEARRNNCYWCTR